MFSSGNLFSGIDSQGDSEQFTELLRSPNVRIERIVSTGQTTPAGKWLDQPENEWVALLQGAAHLRFENESSVRELKPGDYVHIPAHTRHRVDWTDPKQVTIWLAVHFK